MSLREQLDRDGYAVQEAVIDDRCVAALVAAISQAPAAMVLSRRGAAFAQRDILRRIPAIKALSESPAVRHIVDDALDQHATCMRGILFDKVDGANWVVPWHQDRSIAVEERNEVSGFGPWSVKSGIVHCDAPEDLLARMITIRLHLDDCDIANGPLRVIPGSHANGKLSEQQIAATCLPEREKTCTVLTGGAVVMRPLILHASAPAKAPRHRRVIHLEYGPPQLPGGLRWHG